MIESSSI
jgi:hypothetical protein